MPSHQELIMLARMTLPQLVFVVKNDPNACGRTLNKDPPPTSPQENCTQNACIQTLTSKVLEAAPLDVLLSFEDASAPSDAVTPL